MGRCSGHCCRAFRLSLPLLQIRGIKDTEHQFIANMVIPLGAFAPGDNLPDNTVCQTGGEYYTCRHFDPRTGNCVVYHNRPQMCRDLGVTVKCMKPGCTYNA